jgi:hypothetical protein
MLPKPASTAVFCEAGHHAGTPLQLDWQFDVLKPILQVPERIPLPLKPNPEK